MSLKDKRIGVMMGGCSSEREISMKSGSAVLAALGHAGFNVTPLEVREEAERDIRRLIQESATDIVFVAMHGRFGEDGQLQMMLEKIHIPYTGPRPKASRLAMDKIVSRRLFEKAGLCVPNYRRILRVDEARRLKDLHYPVVVKPSSQGSSIGVSFVDAPAGLEDALAEALKFSPTALVEEFVAGREVTVSIFDGKPLPIVEIVPGNQFFDFEAKYAKGLTEYIVPAPLGPSVAERAQNDAVTAYRVLGCRHLSRVDMIIREDGSPCILEVNTIPGMTETSLFPKSAKAAGIEFSELCVRLLQLALRKEK